MKKWHETRQVLARIDAVGQQPAVLATVVCVRGSAYRKSGTKMLVEADGRTYGSVSAGCLEGDVREVALQVMKSGQPVLRNYRSSSDVIEAWDLGLGCDGQVDIYLEPVTAEHRVGAKSFDGHSPFALCTVLRSGHQRFERESHLLAIRDAWNDAPLQLRGSLGCAQRDKALLDQACTAIQTYEASLVEIEDLQIFIDPFRRPPTFVIFGAGDDAVPVATLAATAGFETTVVDWREALLARERFDRRITLRSLSEVDTAKNSETCLQIGCDDFAVVMTHSFHRDAAYLRFLSRFQPRYVGVLGPRQRTRRLLQAASDSGHIDAASLHAPVGLDIGAEGAEAIAVAIVGEMLAVYAARRPVSLSERFGPIDSSTR